MWLLACRPEHCVTDERIAKRFNSKVIVILDYEMGNVGSIRNMFKKIGANAVVSSDPNLVPKTFYVRYTKKNNIESVSRRKSERHMIFANSSPASTCLSHNSVRQNLTVRESGVTFGATQMGRATGYRKRYQRNRRV